MVIGLMLASAAAVPGHAEAVQSARTLPTGLEVRTDKGVLTLEPWSDSIVHVRFGPAGFAGNYNPAVIARPQAVRFNVRQAPDGWSLSTTKLTVRVNKT